MSITLLCSIQRSLQRVALVVAVLFTEQLSQNGGPQNGGPRRRARSKWPSVLRSLRQPRRHIRHRAAI